MTDDPFVTHRSLLFTVAYEMLGSAADAEDVLQEAWLRWADVDQRQVHDVRAYLIRIVTRQALNQMRTLSRCCARSSISRMVRSPTRSGSRTQPFDKSRGAPASMWRPGDRGCR
jgi:DNA-directed RNA polymerase specialized sigma24 family protein